MLRTRAESAEVLYAEETVLRVTAETVAELKRLAAKAPRKRLRLCVHAGPEDRLHQMLIVFPKDAYVRPHRHTDKIESYHVIEGRAEVVEFDENGRMLAATELGEASTGKAFYYRSPRTTYHTLRVLSDVFVFLETTNGPFRREESQPAPWSPAESDAEAARRFVERLRAAVPGDRLGS